MHHQLHFIELIIYKDLTYEAPLLLRILRNLFSSARESRSLEKCELKFSKNGILVTSGLSEKNEWMFPLTFTEADSKPCQISKCLCKYLAALSR